MIKEILGFITACIGISFITMLPILPFFISFKTEYKKDPKGMKKAEKEFWNGFKEVLK